MSFPLILNSPESMLRMRVVTTKDRSEKALKTIHRVGALHVEQSEELRPADREAIEEASNRVGQSLRFINEILSYVPEKQKVNLRDDPKKSYLRPLEEIETDVRVLYDRLSDLYTKVAGLQDEIERLTQDKHYLQPLSTQIDLTLADLSFTGTSLFSRVFVLPAELLQTFLTKCGDGLLHNLSATVENEAVLYVVARTSSMKEIEAAASELGGRALEIAPEDLTLDHFLGVVQSMVDGLEKELQAITLEIKTHTKDRLAEIVLLREVLSAEHDRLSVLGKASEAQYVTLIEGWIPEATVEEAVLQLNEEVDIVFNEVREPAQHEEPPTKLRNMKPFKPFEVVLGLFGLPRYREWDPTPLIAYSFALFFGLMLGDVLYALGLLLAAKFILPFFVDDPESDGFKQFKKLIYISSTVGLIIGLLTGTYLGDFLVGGVFGDDGTSLALVEPARQFLTDVDPIMFIVISLGLGLIHVNIGHLLGLIRGIKEKDKGTILNRIGLFVFEGCAIPVLLSGLLGMNFLSNSLSSLLIYIMPVGILMIIISAFLNMGVLGAIFWLFDLTGVLGDVMSYSRLAGVGLATFYLAQSFNMLASWIADTLSSAIPGMIGLVLGVFLAILILLFAHLLNLALSGLAAFIHSLRLCFVEFLFKFYEAGGRQYEPFCFKSRAFVVLR